MIVSSKANTRESYPILIASLFFSSFIIVIGTVVFGTNYAFYLLAFSIFVTNVLFSLELKKTNIMAFLLLVVLYVLMAATNNQNGLNGDYLAYSSLYNHFLYGGGLSNITGYTTDYGFMILMFLVSKLGISYNIFLALLTLVSIYLIKATISKITTTYNLFLVCYTLTPFFYDVFQIRFFFTYSIILFALQFIIFEKKKSYIKYTLLVLFASLFHKTAIFFLLYLLLKVKLKILIQFILAVSALLAVVSLFTRVNIVNIVFPFIQFSKFEKYTTGEIQYQLNPLTSLAIVILVTFFIFIARSIYIKNPTYTNKVILWINLLSIILFPFFFISLDFERFIRPIMLINYAVIAANITMFTKNVRLWLLISLFAVLSGRQFLLFNVTEKVLDNNYIFDFLSTL